MAAPDPMKHLWKEYNKLKNWLGSPDTASRIFIDQTREDEIEMSSSGPNNGGANSGIQGKHMRIVGLIFPSTAPFRQLGLKVEILMPAGYPREPPVVYMRTDNIRHPNIEKDGKQNCNKLVFFYDVILQQTKINSGCLNRHDQLNLLE